MDRDILADKLKRQDFRRYDDFEYERILEIDRETYDKNVLLALCIEELTELTKELTKDIRGKGDRLGISEEFVDVCFCLEHIRCIFNLDEDELFAIQNIKLERLKEQLGK